MPKGTSESGIEAQLEIDTLAGSHRLRPLYDKLLDAANLPVHEIERLRRSERVN